MCLSMITACMHHHYIDGPSDEPRSDEQFAEIEALSLDGMYTE